MSDRPGPRALIEEITQRHWPSASITTKDSLLAAQMRYKRETVKKWRLKDDAPIWVVQELERINKAGFEWRQQITRSGA